MRNTNEERTIQNNKNGARKLKPEFKEEDEHIRINFRAPAVTSARHESTAGDDADWLEVRNETR